MQPRTKLKPHKRPTLRKSLTKSQQPMKLIHTRPQYKLSTSRSIEATSTIHHQSSSLRSLSRHQTIRTNHNNNNNNNISNNPFHHHKQHPIHHISQRHFRVAILGAANTIGQPLAMLLTRNPTKLLTSIALYDTDPQLPGVSLDLQSIPPLTKTSPMVKIDSYYGRDELDAALDGADIVITTTHLPQKQKQTNLEWFKMNGLIQFDYAKSFARNCPHAWALITSPYWLNSFVPLWAESLIHDDAYNPKKIFGVTGIHQFRVNSIVSNHFKKPLNIPIVGGTSKTTIIPMLSLINGNDVNQHHGPPIQFENVFRSQLMHRVMYAEQDVTQLKKSQPATLSQASSISKFVDSCLYAMAGRRVLNENAYIQNLEAKAMHSVPFFASNISLNSNGVDEIKQTWVRANEYESNMIAQMIPTLSYDIKNGRQIVTDALKLYQKLHNPDFKEELEPDDQSLFQQYQQFKTDRQQEVEEARKERASRGEEPGVRDILGFVPEFEDANDIGLTPEEYQEKMSKKQKAQKQQNMEEVFDEYIHTNPNKATKDKEESDFSDGFETEDYDEAFDQMGQIKKSILDKSKSQQSSSPFSLHKNRNHKK